MDAAAQDAGTAGGSINTPGDASQDSYVDLTTQPYSSASAMADDERQAVLLEVDHQARDGSGTACKPSDSFVQVHLSEAEQLPLRQQALQPPLTPTRAAVEGSGDPHRPVGSEPPLPSPQNTAAGSAEGPQSVAKSHSLCIVGA